VLTEEEKQLLIEIEKYLFSKNKSTIIDNVSVFKVKDLEDPKALQLYFQLYALNEKLIKEGEV
jgi:hypothetical protein